MMTVYGIFIITTFIVFILTKRMSVLTAMIIVPVFFTLVAGFHIKDIGEYSLAGIKQVAPTGVLLMFAILYFSIMLDAGLFSPLIGFILQQVKNDPLKVILGTALLTMIVHLDGDGTATFMIVLSAFMPIYKQLKIHRMILPCIVALSVGPMHLVPWSGTSARALSVMKSDIPHLFNPNIYSMIAGISWVFFVATVLGLQERKRLGRIELIPAEKVNLVNHPTRSKWIWFNAILTISLVFCLVKNFIPPVVLFIFASVIALLVNYPGIRDQQHILKSHAANIFIVVSLIFAAGILSGILNGTKIIDSMANDMAHIIPASKSNLLPLFTALTSMPCSVIFTPDAYYFGVIPVLAKSASQFGMDSLEIARAGLLGQMTVGFPISPLTGSTFLLIGMCGVELGEHQRYTFLWAWGTTIVMTLTAILSGSIHI